MKGEKEEGGRRVVGSGGKWEEGGGTKGEGRGEGGGRRERK